MASTNRDLCKHCLAELTSADYEAQTCTQCGQRLTDEQEAKGMSETKAEYRHRIVKVRRVRDAVGAYCLDCQRVIADVTQWQWSWRKSQVMHEQGSGHKTIMYRLV